jgi:lysophospholipase L1-like esterase
MRYMSRFISLIAIYSIYGCAAPMASEDDIGSEVQSTTQALDKGRLLALGDSIAFGYNPLLSFDKDKAFVGYPEVLKSDYSSKNSSCPGETSASFYSTTAPDNGCRAYRAAYPLHVNYGSNATQLDYALSRLSDPDDVPTLVTLNVSGNDIFLLQKSCASTQNPALCFQQNAPALIGSIGYNVGYILNAIRSAGYTGDLVYMNLYAGTYTDPGTVGFVTALNNYVSSIAVTYGAKIANAYGAFQFAAGSDSPCQAGLLIPLPAGGCDVHPTLFGQQVLAQSVLDALAP